jgi:membrane associated rhomboid family serine protease
MFDLNNLLSQLVDLFDLLKANIFNAALFILLLWVIHLVNVLLRYRLNILGVYPRSGWGLIGIPCFSFLHGSFNHLFFNSIPLIVLINFMLLSGMQKFIHISLTIMLISGVALWLVGRRAIHVGASCLVMGYFGYLLVNAYQHPSLLTIILAIVCLYYFGSLLGGFFPTQEKVSWEGHIFGFLAGLIAVYFFN